MVSLKGLHIFHLYVVALPLILCNCVAIPRRSHAPIPPPSHRLGCEKVGVTTSFTEVIYSDFSVEGPIDPEKRRRGSVNPSWIVLKVLNSSNLFEVEPTKDLRLKYFIAFKIVSRNVANGLQRAHLWLSDLTLGILPGYGDGRYYLAAEIFDSNGSKAADYVSSSVRYNYFHGLIFLPLNFFHSSTLANINEKYLPSMTDEIIDNMIRDKLIKCSGI